MIKSFRALVGSLVSVALCLAVTAALLALLPAARQDQGDAAGGFTSRLQLIGQTVYQRVLLPRSPAASAGYRNWVATLQSATPLLLCGLGIAIAFRAGVLNIGGQGQYIAGAIATASTALLLPGPWRGQIVSVDNATSIVLVSVELLAAMLGGALLAGIAGLLEQWRKVPVVLSTLLLNFVALELLRYLLQGPLRARSEAGTLLDPQSPQLPEAARLPQFFAGTGQGIHLGFFIGVGAALLVGFVIARTTAGFRLRVVGLNPFAARFSGMNTGAISLGALAWSGALAGLAGGVQVCGIAPWILFPDLGTDGVGFAAIAVALLARLAPVGVVFSAIFFGMLATAFRALERSDLEIHSAAAQGVHGLLVLAIVMLTSGNWSLIRNLLKRRPPIER